MTVAARISVERDDFALNVDIEFPDGQFTGIFGPSGSGKSTILRAIAGLDRHRRAFLRFEDQIWQDDRVFLPAHKRPVGYVFQDDALFPHLSVGGNLEYGARRSGTNDRHGLVERSIELLGIKRLLGRNPGSLSGGERQRVSIARALAVGPGLLLLDEPLSSLDRKGKREIIPYLSTIQSELAIPVIYVSHDLDEIARLADGVVLIENGAVKAHEPVNEILTRLDLPVAGFEDAEAVFDAPVKRIDGEFALAVLGLGEELIYVPDTGLSIGHQARIRIAANDVSITLERSSQTSIQNILPAIVDNILDPGGAHVVVRLLCGEVVLLARITRKSVAALEIEPGKQVYAQIKSVVLVD